MPAEDQLKISPLTDDERGFVLSGMSLFFDLAEQAGILPSPEQLENIEDDPDAPDTPELCDDLVRWWHAQPPRTRPDPNQVVSALGIALGDYLRHVYRLEWRVVEDDYGVSLSLVSGDDQHQAVLSPLDSVAKRFADNPDGFISGFVQGLGDVPVLEAILRGEDDDGPEPITLDGDGQA